MMAIVLWATDASVGFTLCKAIYMLIVAMVLIYVSYVQNDNWDDEDSGMYDGFLALAKKQTHFVLVLSSENGLGLD